MELERVFVVDGLRSYIGIQNGMYRHIPAEQLGAAVLKRLAAPYVAAGIDCIIAGNAVGGGGNIARLAALTAGLPQSIPAATIDVQCGSGLESISVAAAKIKSGQAELVIAGGFDSSSVSPIRRYNKNHPDYERYGGEQSWYTTAKFAPGEHGASVMLEGAERTAVSEKMTRQSLNHWVQRSHELAARARDDDSLSGLVAEVIPGCSRDEGIRNSMSTRLLDKLPCVLAGGQVLTAANTCLTNDGAAFVVLCSESILKERGYTPLAEYIDSAAIGGDYMESPRSAVSAIQKLLKRQKLTASDVDIFECNEAFAVIDELFARAFPDCVDRYNIFGGALAYGHPYGASGAIITLHAMRALSHVDGELAVCSVAAAGGVGTSLLLRRA